VVAENLKAAGIAIGSPKTAHVHRRRTRLKRGENDCTTVQNDVVSSKTAKGDDG
jgi:hypothetical protein